MNSKERVLNSINHRSSDRVSITFDAEQEVYRALYDHLGIPAGADAKERLFDALNVDTWMIFPKRLPLDTSVAGHPERYKNYWGIEYVDVTTTEGANYSEIARFPLQHMESIAELDAFPWPTTSMFDYSGLAVAGKRYGQRAIIGSSSWGIFHTANQMRGTEEIMLDFAMNREFLAHMFAKIEQFTLPSMEKMIDSDDGTIDIVYFADDFCSQNGPMFSPADFKEFCVPYLKRMADAIHKRNKKFLLHVCGAVRPLLPMIIDAGVDMLEPIQTSAVGMNPVELKKEFGRDLCFYGGVDIQNTLCRGTVKQVEDEVKYLIDTLGKDGGYILGPGHTYIQVDAPLENILAMYKCGATHPVS